MSKLMVNIREKVIKLFEENSVRDGESICAIFEVEKNAINGVYIISTIKFKKDPNASGGRGFLTYVHYEKYKINKFLAEDSYAYGSGVLRNELARQVEEALSEGRYYVE